MFIILIFFTEYNKTNNKIKLEKINPSEINNKINFAFSLFNEIRTIDSKYYSYDLSGVNNNNLFGIDLSLSDELASGTYTLEYKYYSNKEKRYL